MSSLKNARCAMANEEDGKWKEGQKREQDQTQEPEHVLPQGPEQKQRLSQEQEHGQLGMGAEPGLKLEAGAMSEAESGAEEESGFRSAEVEAFFAKLNYFRQEIRVRNAADTEWRNWHWYAGDRIVQDVLDGERTIGLRASLTTSFIGFDIDVPGKVEEASAGNAENAVNGGSEGWRGAEVEAGEAGKSEQGKEGGRDAEEAGDGRGNDGSRGGEESEGRRKRGEVVRTWVFDDKRTDEERDADRAREERMRAAIAAWAGWDELKELNARSGHRGIDYLDELGMALAEVPEMRMPGRRPTARGVTARELSLELRDAAEIIKSCFTVEPSLAVRSPHGCHLYWCLEENRYWTVVKGIAQRVKEEAEDQYGEIGIERKIEVLPSPTQALRLPRKDRLLEPGSLDAMEEPEDGEAFWKGLKQYRLEEIVKEEVLERRLGEHRRKPYRGPKRRRKREPDEEMTEEEKEELQARATGKREDSEVASAHEGSEGDGSERSEHDGGSGRSGGIGASGGSSGGSGGGGRDGDDSDDDYSDAGESEHDVSGAEHGWRRSKKPRSREEAEEMVLPFQNGKTNPQLIAVVEGGKRSGMTVAEIIDWVKGWIERSRVEGYTGDLGKDERNLESRIDRLYARCNVNVGGKKRWTELWECENGKYARDEERAKRMMEELERVRPLAKQSRPAVERFMGDLDAWRRIVDDEAGRVPSRLDKLTIENQKRGAYPLPHELLQKLYSKYREIWDDVQRAGVLVKDTDKGGGYVPNLGRVQSYIYSSSEV
jgi:uncharacterized membrane protein YgcG